MRGELSRTRDRVLLLAKTAHERAATFLLAQVPSCVLAACAMDLVSALQGSA
jgi:hypothetical protein